MAKTFLAGVGWIDTDRLAGMGNRIDKMGPIKDGQVRNPDDASRDGFTYEDAKTYGEGGGAYGLGKNQLGYSYKPYTGPGQVQRRSDGKLVIAVAGSNGQVTYREFNPRVDMTYKTHLTPETINQRPKGSYMWGGPGRRSPQGVAEPAKERPAWQGPMHRFMPGQGIMPTEGWTNNAPIGAGNRNMTGGTKP